LRQGLRLLLYHGAWAEVSCTDCKRWMRNDDGSYQTRSNGIVRLKVLRPEGALTPCYSCPKIPREAPARTPDHAVELSAKNRQALYHYQGCRAVGRFPKDDPIVTRNAIVIRSLMDAFERFGQDRLYYLLGGKL
jgi:hypothetical protein